jgi:hypothetical protein
MNRNYTVLVSVVLVSPDGKVLANKSETVALKLDMKEFPEGSKAADKHMKGEISSLLSAAAYNVEECFD